MASATCCRHFEVRGEGKAMKTNQKSNNKLVSHWHRVLLAGFIALLFATAGANAQSEDEAAGTGSTLSTVPGEMDGMEALFGEGAKPNNEIIEDGAKKQPTTQTKQGEVEMKGVSDLSSLSEFKDIAVIQKRFLPKTGRFEGFGGLGGILNDKFFVSIGASARLAYFFNERWAIEGVGMAFATGEKGVTSDLREKRGVVTTNFVSPTSYYGVDVKWTPVYGKMSFVNRSITPFDLYFSVGGGITNTNQGGSEPTVHLGTGQIFAITKSAAFRWDFSWNFYNASSGVANAKQNSLYNNLMITLGASFFFPEATYR